jgi:hypothetical protein
MTGFFTCPDCEQPLAPERDALCPACSRWRDKWLEDMNAEYQEQQERKNRRARLRMSPGQRFGEKLADMVKAMERPRQK